MVIDVDFLVLGSGIAGLSYALKVGKLGKVALVTKKNDTESNTNYAQGGIASVFSDEDKFDLHVKDTHVAGAGLCHEDSVDILVKEGPDRVRDLIDLGVRFSKETLPNGKNVLALGREGGHSRRRILHAADLTGREIERALVAQVKSCDTIRVFEHDFGIDLIMANGICIGAHVLDTETGDVATFHAKVTMLATGGLGRVYQHTTNPEIATGDGVAMAYRAGADVGNMEFIQFHPTSLYHKDARSFLISEAVRGEGGLLRLKDGSTFMESYHEMGCLAPRDIVARAIDAELKRTGDECVYLDVTHIDGDRIKTRFPNIYEKCLSVGIDMTKELLPIVPAAHYSCGGVVTDINGKTTIERLYACGEVACTGVHGANRLASNSLLEAVVFAHRAALDAESHISGIIRGTPPAEYPMAGRTELASDDEVRNLIGNLQSTMWRYVGIVRTTERLKKALVEVENIGDRAGRLYSTCLPSAELLELRNLAQVAELIIVSALRRHESRGLHYNLDFASVDDENWKRDTVFDRASIEAVAPA
jgi:L-aspartate oxidase